MRIDTLAGTCAMLHEQADHFGRTVQHGMMYDLHVVHRHVCQLRPNLQQGSRLGLIIRSVGLARARTGITLANLAYNMRRLAWLDGRIVPA